VLTSVTHESRKAGFTSGEVDLYWLPLDQPESIRRSLAALLSADEQARASRFVFDRHRHEYIVCRGMLRQLLSGYLGAPARDIRFAYGERGKPALATTSSTPVEFNVSHAAGVAVFAFAGIPVGVDVESLDRTVDCQELASRFFSSEESEQVLAQPPAERTEAFLNCWTRKEAYIKAIGDGLACPLDSFAVTLGPAEPARMKWIAGDQAERWQMEAFRPADGYVGAVAIQAPTMMLRIGGSVASRAVNATTSKGVVKS
jgi:4'-phosphopantetheinyl transferase